MASANGRVAGIEPARLAREADRWPRPTTTASRWSLRAPNET